MIIKPCLPYLMMFLAILILIGRVGIARDSLVSWALDLPPDRLVLEVSAAVAWIIIIVAS